MSSADEILWLARWAGVGPGSGAGPLLRCRRARTAHHRDLGGTYLGVDQDAGAVGLARARADGLSLPVRGRGGATGGAGGPFDVVLLLETMLAFRDKKALLLGVSTALVPGGRFAFTLEEGQPLTAGGAGRELPAADTVWPVPLPVLVGLLADVGLRVGWLQECTREPPAGRRHPARRLPRGPGRDIAADLGDGRRRWPAGVPPALERVADDGGASASSPSSPREGRGPAVNRPGRRSRSPGRTPPDGSGSVMRGAGGGGGPGLGGGAPLPLVGLLRDADFFGPAFLLNAVAGAGIAVLLFAWRHWVPAFLALGFGLSTLPAFVLRPRPSGSSAPTASTGPAGPCGSPPPQRSSRSSRVPGCSRPWTTRSASRVES